VPLVTIIGAIVPGGGSTRRTPRPIRFEATDRRSDALPAAAARATTPLADPTVTDPHRTALGRGHRRGVRVHRG